MSDYIRMLSKFMDLPDNVTLSEEQIQTITNMSTKDYMSNYNTLFDEPYERAKKLGRAGDLSQLAPGNKVATKVHTQKLNETAEKYLTDTWTETMAPLGYDSYADFAASFRQRNRTRFS